MQVDSFYDAYSFSEGLAAVCEDEDDEEWGFINKSGEYVIEPQFDGVESFSDGMALIYDDGEYGYINKKGEIVIRAKYEDASDFSSAVIPPTVSVNCSALSSTFTSNVSLLLTRSRTIW